MNFTNLMELEWDVILVLNTMPDEKGIPHTKSHPTRLDTGDLRACMPCNDGRLRVQWANAKSGLRQTYGSDA